MVEFFLNNKKVKANENETIWQVAKKNGIVLPHLCFSDKPGYRADGNCRACMVEVEGERTLAASCCREVSDGMVVKTDNDRVQRNRKLVFELLAADMPGKNISPDPKAAFWSQAELGSPRFARLFDWLFWYRSCTRGLRLGGVGYRRCGSCISGAWHSSGCFHGICLWLAVAY